LAQVLSALAIFVPACLRLPLRTMRVVLAVVAALSRAGAVVGDGTSSLRGNSAEQVSIPEAEVAPTLDALSDIFFALDDSMEQTHEDTSLTSTGNKTEAQLGLSANVAVEAGCSQGWAGLVEGIAPGCLGQCTKYGICGSISAVVGVWTKTHDKNKARRKACTTPKAFDCLLWGSHRAKCQPLIARAPKYGIPANVGQACHRRLDAVDGDVETAQEEPSHDNATLDAIVSASLSNAASGCYASTSALRNCGARCFGKHSGSARVTCIADCLTTTVHQSASCCTCYASRSDCTLSKCFQTCARSATSSECTTCVHSKCGGDCR